MKTKGTIKTVKILGALGVFLFLITSCLVSEAFLNELLYGPESTPSVSEPPSVDVSGIYDTEVEGEVEFEQDGDRVMGSYPGGMIDGTLTGNVLEGIWSGAYSSGYVYLKFSSDSSRFDGYYTTGSDTADRTDWTGVKITTASGTTQEPPEQQGAPSSQTINVSGTYESEGWGEIVLEQENDQVSGTYSWGIIEGKLTGNRLEGNWSGNFGGVGKMILDFSSDAGSFSGYYANGYDIPGPDNPNSERWTGSRKTTSLNQVGQTPAPQGPAVEQSTVAPVSAKVSQQQSGSVPAPSESKVYTVGMTGPAGGIVFYDKGDNSEGWRYLEVAPQAAEMVKMWAPNTETSVGVYDVAMGMGKSNTEQIARAYEGKVDGAAWNEYAATACEALTYGGHDDWFLPSIDELHAVFEVVHKQGSGGFADALYWTSNEWADASNVYTFHVHFDDSQGSIYISPKTDANRVRPVRAFGTAEATIQSSGYGANVSGTYESENWGEVVLKQNGNQVAGTYSGGTIEGTLTDNVLEGVWYGSYSSGKLRLEFSADSSWFDGYHTTGTSVADRTRWTGTRTGTTSNEDFKIVASQPQGDTVGVHDGGRFQNLYGGWIDINEKMSGFVFKSDGTLLLFFDGEIAEGFWESDGETLLLSLETDQGDFVAMEGSYKYDGENLRVFMDGDELILAAHWVESVEDVRAYYEQAGLPSGGTQFSVAGVYDSNFGKFALVQNGNSVTGEYPYGKAVGILSDRVYSGTFESMGTTGKFSLTFNPDASEFTGKMIVDQYTDYLWEGTRISEGVPSVVHVQDTLSIPGETVQSEYEVGDRGPAGGIVFYDKGESSNGWRYLEVAPPQAEMMKPWAPDTQLDIGVYDYAIGTGEANTERIVRAYASTMGDTSRNGYAATSCDALSHGGYDDWFLPSTYELAEIYMKVHIQGLGGFSNDFYWTSTEYDAAGNQYAAYVHFDMGSQYIDSKEKALRVRPIRAF